MVGPGPNRLATAFLAVTTIAPLWCGTARGEFVGGLTSLTLAANQLDDALLSPRILREIAGGDSGQTRDAEGQAGSSRPANSETTGPDPDAMFPTSERVKNSNSIGNRGELLTGMADSTYGNGLPAGIGAGAPGLVAGGAGGGFGSGGGGGGGGGEPIGGATPPPAEGGPPHLITEPCAFLLAASGLSGLLLVRRRKALAKSAS